MDPVAGVLERKVRNRQRFSPVNELASIVKGSAGFGLRGVSFSSAAGALYQERGKEASTQREYRERGVEANAHRGRAVSSARTVELIPAVHGAEAATRPAMRQMNCNVRQGSASLSAA